MAPRQGPKLERRAVLAMPRDGLSPKVINTGEKVFFDERSKTNFVDEWPSREFRPELAAPALVS